jgi:selenocysteine-specific elongation factor
VIVAVVGHVDHGKTALVRALTGVDCDRLPEERARGVTTDLGFAHVYLGQQEVGFIDIPGHERYLPNAIGGIFACTGVLLVVAADEGVRPQTREHLELCRLLEIASVLPVMTKADQIPDALVTTRQNQIADEVAEFVKCKRKPIPVSAHTGQGLEVLRCELARLAQNGRRRGSTRPTRVAIDRAFVLKGTGVVVAGTLRDGVLQRGDRLRLMPSGQAVRVKALQEYGVDRETLTAVTRASVLLSGVSREQVRRGDELFPDGFGCRTTSVLARLCAVNSAAFEKRATPVRFFINSNEVMGVAIPLLREPDGQIVRVSLNSAVTAACEDRFVLCDPATRRVIGGGSILDPRWRRMGGLRQKTRIAARTGGMDELLYTWIHEAAERGVNRRVLAAMAGQSIATIDGALSRLTNVKRIRVLCSTGSDDALWLSEDVFSSIRARAATLFHDTTTHAQSGWMSKATLASRLCRKSSKHGLSVVEALIVDGMLYAEGPLITASEMVQSLRDRCAVILEAFKTARRPEAVQPVRLEVIASAGSLDLASTQEAVEWLCKKGQLHRIASDLYVDESDINQIQQRCQVRAMNRFRVGDFTGMFGLTRKTAIPLLEYLDHLGVTERIGNERVLRAGVEQ